MNPDEYEWDYTEDLASDTFFVDEGLAKGLMDVFMDMMKKHAKVPEAQANEEQMAVAAVAKEKPWALPSEDEFGRVLAETKPKDVAVVVADEELLASGMFDCGASYVMEEMEPRDPDAIWVYDKFGEKRQYFRNRFRVVFE